MLQDKIEDELNAAILRLTYACPVDQNNRNCPLKEIRRNDFTERNNWVFWLSFLEKQDIYQRHKVCFSRHQTKAGFA